MPVSSVVPLARPVGARQASAAPAVEVLGVNFNYGERQALIDVSFAVAPAEIFGLLGPNGGGKTTLFKLISTLIPLQSGSARVFGHDLGGETVALRRRIGVVFQHPSVDRKLTVAENVVCHGRLYGISGRRLNERTAAVLKQLSWSPDHLLAVRRPSRAMLRFALRCCAVLAYHVGLLVDLNVSDDTWIGEGVLLAHQARQAFGCFLHADFRCFSSFFTSSSPSLPSHSFSFERASLSTFHPFHCLGFLPPEN